MSIEIEIERLGTEFGTTQDHSILKRAEAIWGRYTQEQTHALKLVFAAAYRVASAARQATPQVAPLPTEVPRREDPPPPPPSEET